MVDIKAGDLYSGTLPSREGASRFGRQAMERILTNTGISGRGSGRPVVCPCVWDIALSANGRSLPVGGDT